MLLQSANDATMSPDELDWIQPVFAAVFGDTLFSLFLWSDLNTGS